MVESFLAACGLAQDDLPTVNAVLNSTCTVLLVLGYRFIRRGRIRAHMTCMLTATGVSALFLASYLYYHFAVRHGEPTRFSGTDWVRPIYFTILISHTILAAVVALLVPITIVLGFLAPSRHRRLARWTLPIWLYVSVTGVIVYWMLYRLYPPAG